MEKGSHHHKPYKLKLQKGTKHKGPGPEETLFSFVSQGPYSSSKTGKLLKIFYRVDIIHST